MVPHWTPLFGLLAVIGGAAVGTVRYGREFEVDQERVAIHRIRYGEWISDGALPATLAGHPFVVPMASLESLADVAIDSETRVVHDPAHVVHDPAQDCYAVLTGGAVYVFTPETDSVDEWPPADA